MPLHTYRCKKCAHEVEVLVLGDRGVPRKCAKCGSPRLERRLGGFSVRGGSSGKKSPSSSCDATTCAPT